MFRFSIEYVVKMSWLYIQQPPISYEGCFNPLLKIINLSEEEDAINRGVSGSRFNVTIDNPAKFRKVTMS